MPPTRLLIVEDDAPYANLVRDALRREGRTDADIAWVDRAEHAEKALIEEEFGVVLADLGLPDTQGVETVKRLRHAAQDPAIVVLSGRDEMSLALESIRAGAQDYLVKDQLHPLLLARAIRYGIERKRLDDMERLVLAIASHDLRNPLSTIAVGTELLSQDPSLSDESQNTLGRMRASAHRAQHLVHDLLDVARLRVTGGLPIRFHDVDVAEVARSIVREAEVLHVERDVRLDVQGDPLVRADAARLDQLLSNLVGNAIQHSAQDEPVEIGVRGHPDHVELEVRNAGTLPPEVCERLFHPFDRGHHASENGHGSGLGLYIVQHIIHRHGGQVEVSSDEATGTTVRVVLPRLPTGRHSVPPPPD
ncbi:MAG: ATP-binding protein [Myxococcota bacterium]